MTWPQVYVRNGGRETIGELQRWQELKRTAVRIDVGRWELTTSSPDEAALLSPAIDGTGAIVEPRGVIIRRAGKTLASGWCEGARSEERRVGKGGSARS